MISVSAHRGVRGPVLPEGLALSPPSHFEEEETEAQGKAAAVPEAHTKPAVHN